MQGTTISCCYGNKEVVDFTSEPAEQVVIMLRGKVWENVLKPLPKLAARDNTILTQRTK